jgi:hypothetical protein
LIGEAAPEATSTAAPATGSIQRMRRFISPPSLEST